LLQVLKRVAKVVEPLGRLQPVGGGAQEVHCHSWHFNAFDEDGACSLLQVMKRVAKGVEPLGKLRPVASTPRGTLQPVGGGAKEVHCHSRHFHAFDMDGDPSAVLDLERGAALDLEVVH